MNLRRASLMVDILMPVSILLIFYPPCLQWYASGVMSIVFLLQKGLFLVCAAYALKYRLYRNKYMVALLSYIVWLILVTYLNGMQIGDIGSYLNVFSCCVVYVYCLERNPQRIIGYTSIVFTLLLLFNTILWKDGGMYVNNSGQMSFVLGTKTSLTEYQIAACGFIGTYFTLLPKHKKKNAVILGLCVVYSIIVWNIHQPISTSEMCLAVFFVILILGALGGKIGEIVLKWGFLGLNILNISIVFFNAQMLFANFITNVLHENADLNHRTAIWQVVLAKIAESPLIGHGLNMGNVSFAVGQGIAGINQATHNGILYFVFSSGIIGTVYEQASKLFYVTPWIPYHAKVSLSVIKKNKSKNSSWTCFLCNDDLFFNIMDNGTVEALYGIFYMPFVGKLRRYYGGRNRNFRLIN